jgi:hypothetical protein
LDLFVILIIHLTNNLIKFKINKLIRTLNSYFFLKKKLFLFSIIW